jgi:SAM-dependent methyltransferase
VWGVACSAEALPIAAASLDTILLIEVLQFVDDDRAAIREISRVLRPGGVWVCEQDSPPQATTMVAVAERRLQKRRVGYSPEALSALAAEAGLELVSMRIVSGPTGRWWESVDGRIFGRSRTLHSVLFPFIRALSWLTTPQPVTGESGSVLYLFRKQGGNGTRSGGSRRQ